MPQMTETISHLSRVLQSLTEAIATVDHSTESLGFFYFFVLFLIIALTAFPRTRSARLYSVVPIFITACIDSLYRFVPISTRVDWLERLSLGRHIPVALERHHSILLDNVRLLFSLFALALILFALVFGSGDKERDSSSSSKDDGKLRKLKPRGEQFQLTVHRGDDDKSRTCKPMDQVLEEQKLGNVYISELERIAQEENLSVYSAQFAQFLDSKSQFSSTYRSQFYYPQNKIYLCGNSLGLQPKNCSALIQEELDKWKNCAVDGHFEGTRPWFSIEEVVRDRMAHVVGAKPTEVAIMNTLTTNLHLLLVGFYRPSAKRYKILIEENPFPSDMHALTSHIISRGYDPEKALIQVGPRKGESIIRTEDILDVIEREGDSIAVILFGNVQFMSGQAFEMEKITKAGHAKGCIVGFDLAHAAGNINLKLHDWGVDFACWCTYKYINSGPGNIAGIFVHERHSQKDLDELPRYAGWWGTDRETRFRLTNRFEPQLGAGSFQLSNPPVVCMMALLSSLHIFEQANIDTLRQKSLRLTTYLEMLLDREPLNGKHENGKQYVQIITPRDPEQRGCQLSIRVAIPVMQVMSEFKTRGVVCDEREPDIIRVAPTPLYNTFEEVYQFVKILTEVLTSSDDEKVVDGDKGDSKELRPHQKKKKKNKKTTK